MTIGKIVNGLMGALIGLGSIPAMQLPFREYPAIEYNNFPVPPDYQVKTEWAFARLMYPPAPTARFSSTFPKK